MPQARSLGAAGMHASVPGRRAGVSALIAVTLEHGPGHSRQRGYSVRVSLAVPENRRLVSIGFLDRDAEPDVIRRGDADEVRVLQLDGHAHLTFFAAEFHDLIVER